MADRNWDRFEFSMASSEITLEAVPSVSDIPAAEWDACANPKADPNSLENLDTLASPGAAGDSCRDSEPPITPSFRTPFLPPPKPPARPAPAPAGVRGISLARLDGKIAGIVPCYLKSHSQGEYVFDRGWADAYERAGGRYYPKLQASVPFTPATGPRLLIRGGVDRERIGAALAQRADGAVQRDQRLLGARHLRARGGSEVSGRPRIPAAHRPAVPLAQ